MNRESKNFLKLVKDVRTQLGLSQEDLAHKLGVSFATINRWENGKTKPSRLAKAQFDSFLSQMKTEGRFHER